MTTSPVILILGAGSNLGQAVAQRFLTNGYKVATSSRKPSPTENKDLLHIQSDFSDPTAVTKLFTKVKTQLGTPNVVVYNAYAHLNAPKDNPLDISLETFQQHLNANTTSTYVAAQQAVAGFRELPESMNKVFIYTGNMLNTATEPRLLTLGVGKKAASYIIEAAAKAYEPEGFRWVPINRVLKWSKLTSLQILLCRRARSRWHANVEWCNC
jgi:NAD(P)-dependent dehydrogenase (short-subunit alcohol dehydrogenase family)